MGKILTGITLFWILFIIRTYIIPLEIFSIEITFLEDIVIKFNVYKDLLLGFLAVIIRLIALGFWEEVIRAYGYVAEKIPMDGGGSFVLKDPLSTNNYMDKGQNPDLSEVVTVGAGEKGSTSSSSSATAPVTAAEPAPTTVPAPATAPAPAAREAAPISSDQATTRSPSQVSPAPAVSAPDDVDPILLGILAEKIVEDTRDLNKSIHDLSNHLKPFRELPFDEVKLKSGSEGTEDALLPLLQKQGNNLTMYIKNRTIWLSARSANALPQNQVALREIHMNIVKIQTDYRAKIDKIIIMEDKTSQLKVFYATINEYRNLTFKELNKADNIILEDLRASALNKFPKVRKAINLEYAQAKNEYKTQDGYIKMKVGEILAKKKQ